MPKMIQLRHVPDTLHRKLKSRAAKKGVSLSDYLVAEIEKLSGRPTMEELIERVARREPVVLKEPVAVVIRRMRDQR